MPVGKLIEQENLNLSPGAASSAQQTRGDDLAVIDDENGFWRKILSDIGKYAVADGLSAAVKDHEARPVPVRARVLGDQVFGDIGAVRIKIEKLRVWIPDKSIRE